MQRWEPVDPAELARTAHLRARRVDWHAVGWWAAAFGFSALFWTALIAAYLIGQR